ncbi:hypothetical protein Pla52n_65340 [Stieleria varia]|uniref:Uncharacterized protein n=1 Tax=Stieleria varia TaxID=2528005 RepID=A0A5C5ZZ05_9BACT|nr:hypothetical protein Pla52n_65340 [Stieleria varia]
MRIARPLTRRGSLNQQTATAGHALDLESRETVVRLSDSKQPQPQLFGSPGKIHVDSSPADLLDPLSHHVFRVMTVRLIWRAKRRRDRQLDDQALLQDGF